MHVNAIVTRRVATWLGALVVAIVASAPAYAQPEAERVQAQLRDWVKAFLAPALVLTDVPLTVGRDGAHYLLTLPASIWAGDPGQDISAELRPLDGGAWALDGLRIPLAGRIGDVGTTKSAQGSEASYKIGEQTVRGIIDPTLRRRSTFNLEARDVTVAVRGGGEKQSQRTDRYTFQGTLIPGSDGRFDVVQEAALSGWETSIEQGKDVRSDVTMRRARMSMRVDGVRGDRLGAAFEAAKGMIAAIRDDPAAGQETARTLRRLGKTLVESLRDMADRLEGDETIDDFEMTVPGMGTLAIEQFRIALGGEAPDGRLRAWTEFAVDGLDLPDLPKSIRDYLPERVAMRPVISGIPTERIIALLLRALDEDADMTRLDEEGRSLLTASGTMIGVENLQLELDPLKLEGNGRLRLLQPDKVGIEARISTVGLDKLMAEAGKDPDLRAAMPILLMVRGLARQENDRMVWDLVVTEDQALVNGVDVLAMQVPPDPPPQRRQNKR